MELNEPIAIRIHGRGGQGAVTLAEVVAQAAIGEENMHRRFLVSGRKKRRSGSGLHQNRR